MKTFALRLKPGQDLRLSLKEYAQFHHLQAACILSAIGSLKQATIRFANQASSAVLEQSFEILSLNGTFSVHGMHLHISVADKFGKTLGGHLDNGCIIYTTAEIVVAELPDLVFSRTLEPQTGFLELEITGRSNQDD